MLALKVFSLRAIADRFTEDDILGVQFDVAKPALQKVKVEELTFWLKCRGDNCKGLKRKA